MTREKIPWDQIEDDYIVGGLSITDLENKYDVSRSTLGRRSKKEEWVKKRKQFANKTKTKKRKKQQDKEVRLGEKYVNEIYNGLELALKNVVGQLNRVQDPYETKTAIQSLKMLMDMSHESQMLKREEMTERINSLRRANQEETIDNKIEIVISGELEEYAN